MSTTTKTLLAALALALAWGCGSEPNGGDADAGGCPEAPAFEAGGDGATALALPPPGGRAVAGRITSEGQLLRGLKPRGRVGDFLLANDRVAFVIEDARPSDGYGPWGGEVLDADLVGEEGPAGESLFGEMLLGVLPDVLRPETVSVLADGSDGGAAVVRAAGHLATIWLIQDCCSTLFPPGDELEAALDYVLEPGAEAVELRLTLRNGTERVLMPDSVLTVLIGGDGARRYAPGVGFDDGASFGCGHFVALVGERVSYAWVAQEGSLCDLLSISGFTMYDSAAVDLPACEDTTLVIGRLAVAGGDASAVEAAVRRVSGQEALAAVTGRVTEADGSPAAGARVHVVDGSGEYRTMGRAGADGAYRVEVEPGSYTLAAWTDDRRPTPAAEVTVDGSGATADLAFGPSGLLAWTAVDGEGDEIPAKVSVLPLDAAAPAAAAAFGEAVHPSGAVRHAFSLPGRTAVRLDAGRYRVVASRGYEHEVDEVEVEVLSGETAEVELSLPRTVDTTGWVTGDFHVHTMYSPDSNDLLDWKVAASAAVGLEIPVCTDHRWVGELQPTVERLGLERFVQWFPGHELTTFSFGHFNAYPLEARPEAPNDGAFDVAGRSPLELFADVRADPLEPILQVNHPRGDMISSYFSWVGLDPETLEVERPEGWSMDFDAIEVWNEADWLDTRDSTVLDWLGMLAHGHLVTALGNSDSHNAEWHDVGYPRNYLHLGTDDPREVTREMLRDAVRQGRVVVSGGLFVTVEADSGEGPGEVAAAPGGVARVRVRVQAPTFVDADVLELFVDGVSVEQVTLDESTEDPEDPVVRLDRTFDVPFDRDGWVLAAAWSEGSLAPATLGRRPFGVTNPLYFDVDGDGEYADSGRTTR